MIAAGHGVDTPIPDLVLVPEVLDAAAEACLLAGFAGMPLVTPPYDAGNDRASISFGWEYDYVADSFEPCQPVPPLLEPLSVLAAGIAGVPPGAFAECYVNRYGPGAVIQPHVDKPVWDKVVGISLGSDATMRFDRPADGRMADVLLPARSLYILHGAARHAWRHSLPPVEQTRWSVTFRTFSEHGLRLRAASVA